MKASQIFKAQWKQLRGMIKEEWGKLTHNNTMRMEGQRDQMIGGVQEKYGSTIVKAQKNASRWLKKINLH